MSHYDSPPPSGNGLNTLPVTDTNTTSSFDPGTSYGGEPSSTAEVAVDQAKQVGQEALEGGRQAAKVAAGEASSVVSEAGTQAKNLLGEARTQLTDQAASQQHNLAAWVSSVVDELDGMLDRSQSGEGAAQSGAATALMRQVSSRARGAANWLEDHEPADLLTETSRFARQRPGLFLALAAAGGLVAGRFTRGLTADSSASHSSPAAATTGEPMPVVERPLISQTTPDLYRAQPVIGSVPEPYTAPEPAWNVR